MPYNFEKLEVWSLALEYIDGVYELAAQLPKSEAFNLGSQITRAATSIALNIAEGSTGQTRVEYARFVGMALRSLVETVACTRLIERRGYVHGTGSLATLEEKSNRLAAKLQALRRSLAPDKPWAREAADEYTLEP